MIVAEVVYFPIIQALQISSWTSAFEIISWGLSKIIPRNNPFRNVFLDLLSSLGGPHAPHQAESRGRGRGGGWAGGSGLCLPDRGQGLLQDTLQIETSLRYLCYVTSFDKFNA